MTNRVSAAPGEVVYKIVDIVDGNIKTLFHGLAGSKVMPVNKWMVAAKKRVRDGTSKTWYLSGWHVFRHHADAMDYLYKFQNLEPKAIARCRARGLRPKEHSPSPVLLADDLNIERIIWSVQEGWIHDELQTE